MFHTQTLSCHRYLITECQNKKLLSVLCCKLNQQSSKNEQYTDHVTCHVINNMAMSHVTDRQINTEQPHIVLAMMAFLIVQGINLTMGEIKCKCMMFFEVFQ